MINGRLLKRLTFLSCSLFFINNSYAVYTCDGCVVSAVGASTIAITTGQTAQTSALITELQNIGSTESAGLEKATAMIETTAKASMEYQSDADYFDKQAELREKYAISPNLDTICSRGENSGGSIASTSKQLANGKGFSLPTKEVKRAVEIDNEQPNIDSALSTNAHNAKYCSAEDLILFGGEKSDICKEEGKHPNADKDVNSIFVGNDETLTDDTLENALMYVKNTTPSVSRNINAADTKTEQGKMLIGKKIQRDAVISAAKEPMLYEISKSLPSEKANVEYMLDAGSSTDGTVEYFVENMSETSKQLKKMSENEYLKLDVGSHYDNPDWYSYIYSSYDEDLLREQIILTALNQKLLYELLSQQKRTAIIDGLILTTLKNMDSRAELSSNEVKAEGSR